MKKILSVSTIIVTLILASSYMWGINEWDRRNDWWVIPSYMVILVIVAVVTWVITRYGWSKPGVEGEVVDDKK